METGSSRKILKIGGVTIWSEYVRCVAIEVSWLADRTQVSSDCALELESAIGSDSTVLGFILAIDEPGKRVVEFLMQRGTEAFWYRPQAGDEQLFKALLCTLRDWDQNLDENMTWLFGVTRPDAKEKLRRT